MECLVCDNEASPGKQKCKEHLALASQQQQQRSKAWIDQGLCDRCGKRKPDEGRKRCVECRKQQNGDARKYQADLLRRGICFACCERKADATKYYCSVCVIGKNENSRKRNQAIKLEIFAAYGGPVCICCGETEILFLSLDHINNDGAAHRTSIFGKRVGNLYEWVRRNKFPPIFQVLCMNCNFGKRMNGGVCPHKSEVKGTV